jgi:hypothetical protein
VFYKETRHTNPEDFQMRSVIRFLKPKNIRPAEFHRQLVEVYVEVVMNEWNLKARVLSSMI